MYILVYYNLKIIVLDVLVYYVVEEGVYIKMPALLKKLFFIQSQ